MSRAGMRVVGSAGHGGNKSSAQEEGAQEMVPLSLQKLRELADSLRASMPVDDAGEDKGGSPSPNKNKSQRKKQDKAKRRQGAQDANNAQGIGHMEQIDLQQAVDNMREKYQSLCDEHDKMISEGKKSQQAYIRREVQYKSQIARMKELLGKAVLSRGGEDSGMPNKHAKDLNSHRESIRKMHQEIMEKLSAKQEETREIIDSHEKEMLLVFRNRLFEVEDKVRQSGAKKGSDVKGGVPRMWIDKANRLARELDHYKEESVRLDGENERLTKESTRLQAEHKSHLDDLAYLENQMSTLKKENLRLRKDLEETATVSMRNFLSSAHTLADDADHDHEPPDSRPGTGWSGESEAERERQAARMAEAMGRIRKLIAEERTRLREVRTGHVAALASRTELEGFLRDALSDVKRQISKHRMDAMESIQGTAQGEALGEERDKVLELLLSQERVIGLLYDKTFPVKSALSAYGGPRALSRAGREASEVGSEELAELLPEVDRAHRGVAGEPGGLAYLHDPSWDTLGRAATPSRHPLTARSNETMSGGSPTSSHPD